MKQQKCEVSNKIVDEEYFINFYGISFSISSHFIYIGDRLYPWTSIKKNIIKCDHTRKILGMARNVFKIKQ